MTDWDTARVLNKMLSNLLGGLDKDKKHSSNYFNGLTKLANNIGKIGKSSDFISDRLDLIKASEKIQEAVRSKRISLSQQNQKTRLFTLFLFRHQEETSPTKN